MRERRTYCADYPNAATWLQWAVLIPVLAFGLPACVVGAGAHGEGAVHPLAERGASDGQGGTVAAPVEWSFDRGWGCEGDHASAQATDISSERRSQLLGELRAHPRHIGDFLLVPARLEIHALEASGAFEQVTGHSLAELRYDFSNIQSVAYDRSAGCLTQTIPKGSLILILTADGNAETAATCALYEGDDFVCYDFPTGVQGNSQGSTGIEGSLGAFMTPDTVVVGFVPPGRN